MAIGAFFGAIPAGILADKLGRKYTSMMLSVPFLLTWVLTVSASSVNMLYAARLFAGIATGGACVVAPMFISEIGETSIRGALGSFFQLFLTVGILLVYLIGSYIDWRILSGLCAIPPILLLVGMIFLPESPTYLMKKVSGVRSSYRTINRNNPSPLPRTVAMMPCLPSSPTGVPSAIPRLPSNYYRVISMRLQELLRLLIWSVSAVTVLP